MTESPSDEEMAFELVELYFQQIARLGFKRKLDLDAIINAYFYTLQRLKNKEIELEAMRKLVEEEEKQILKEEKGDLFPTME